MPTQRWIDEGSHYTWPVPYSSHVAAQTAAWQLEDQFKIHAEVAMEEDEGQKIWRIITRNNVLHASNWRE